MIIDINHIEELEHAVRRDGEDYVLVCHNKIPQNLTTEIYFLMVLEVGSSRSRLAELDSPKASLLGIQMVTFSLHPHMVKRRSSGVSSFSYKGTNSHGDPILMTS